MSLELGTEELAVAVARSSDLTAKINQALTALQQEGVLDDLAAQYGLTGGADCRLVPLFYKIFHFVRQKLIFLRCKFPIAYYNR